MATFTISIPDDKVQDVVDTLCLAWGHRDDIGMTKGQYVKFIILSHIRGAYQSQVAKALIDAAQTSANTTAQTQADEALINVTIT